MPQVVMRWRRKWQAAAAAAAAAAAWPLAAAQLKVLNAPPGALADVSAPGDVLMGATATFGSPAYGDSLTGIIFFAETSRSNYCAPDYEPLGETPAGDAAAAEVLPAGTATAAGVAVEGAGSAAGPAARSAAGSALKRFFIVPRGDCSFVQKALAAQSLGADAVIFVDSPLSPWTTADIGGVILADDGRGANVRIPSIMLSKEQGRELIRVVAASRKRGGTLALLRWSLPQRNVVVVDFWTEAGSTAGQRFLEGYAYHAALLGGHLRFQPHYHVWSLLPLAAEGGAGAGAAVGAEGGGDAADAGGRAGAGETAGSPSGAADGTASASDAGNRSNNSSAHVYSEATDGHVLHPAGGKAVGLRSESAPEESGETGFEGVGNGNDIHSFFPGLNFSLDISLCLPDDPSVCSNPGDLPGGAAATGRAVLHEDARQLCLFELTAGPDSKIPGSRFSRAWWEYVRRFDAECAQRKPLLGVPAARPAPLPFLFPPLLPAADRRANGGGTGGGGASPGGFTAACSEAVMRDIAGVDAGAVLRCAEERGPEMLREQRDTRAWSNLALRINGARYAGSLDPSLVSRAVCAAFERPPDVCRELLSPAAAAAAAAAAASAGAASAAAGGAGFSAARTTIAAAALAAGAAGAGLAAYQVYHRRAIRSALRHEVFMEVRSQLQDYRLMGGGAADAAGAAGAGGGAGGGGADGGVAFGVAGGGGDVCGPRNYSNWGEELQRGGEAELVPASGAGAGAREEAGRLLGGRSRSRKAGALLLGDAGESTDEEPSPGRRPPAA